MKTQKQEASDRLYKSAKSLTDRFAEQYKIYPDITYRQELVSALTAYEKALQEEPEKEPRLNELAYVPYQRCPICEGSGKALNYDLVIPTVFDNCKRCEGTGTILMSELSENPIVRIPGMKKRELFAAMAMQGILAHHENCQQSGLVHTTELSIQSADELLKQLKESGS